MSFIFLLTLLRYQGLLRLHMFRIRVNVPIQILQAYVPARMFPISGMIVCVHVHMINKLFLRFHSNK